MFLKIIGIIVLWFIIGAIINFVYYSDTPIEYHGKNENAKTAHIIINIITVIVLLISIFS